jgi:hypothetical protein
MNAATRAYIIGELIHLRQCELPRWAINEAAPFAGQRPAGRAESAARRGATNSS